MGSLLYCCTMRRFLPQKLEMQSYCSRENGAHVTPTSHLVIKSAPWNFGCKFSNQLSGLFTIMQTDKKVWSTCPTGSSLNLLGGLALGSKYTLYKAHEHFFHLRWDLDRKATPSRSSTALHIHFRALPNQWQDAYQRHIRPDSRGTLTETAAPEPSTRVSARRGQAVTPGFEGQERSLASVPLPAHPPRLWLLWENIPLHLRSWILAHSCVL